VPVDEAGDEFVNRMLARREHVEILELGIPERRHGAL